MCREEVRDHFAEVKARGEQANAEWNKLVEAYKAAHPELGEQFEQAAAGELPDGWDADLPVYDGSKAVSTRVASGEALNALAKRVPNLVGGSADLESSTMTHLKGLAGYTAGQLRRTQHLLRRARVRHGGRDERHRAARRPESVRRHVLRVHGLSPSGRPTGGIDELPVVYVLTHDSIAVGEDGPTHEPIEQLASIRVIPDLTVIRPADATRRPPHGATRSRTGRIRWRWC